MPSRTSTARRASLGEQPRTLNTRWYCAYDPGRIGAGCATERGCVWLRLGRPNDAWSAERGEPKRGAVAWHRWLPPADCPAAFEASEASERSAELAELKPG